MLEEFIKKTENNPMSEFYRRGRWNVHCGRFVISDERNDDGEKERGRRGDQSECRGWGWGRQRKWRKESVVPGF